MIHENPFDDSVDHFHSALHRAWLAEELQARQFVIHTALLIYTVEQLGYPDVFQRCFSYVGGTLYHWDIYEGTI